MVVGAGPAGIYMLHRLRSLGLRAVVLEAGDDIGGTWYWNRYPGARCDVESLDYSYSFCPALEQEWEWSERYPAQPEMLAYLRHVVERFDLRRDMRLSTRVTAAHYDEESSLWRVHTDTGEILTARFCIMATGCLSVPKLPETAGLETFQGLAVHTARWPAEGVDIRGKRVGVIGTGSSAVQCAPVLARQAAEVTVFQRTAGYCLPAHNRPLDPDEQSARKREYPAYRQRARHSAFGVPEAPPMKSALAVEPQERTATYWQHWQAGGPRAMLAAYYDLLVSKKANDTAAEFVRARIRDGVDDPATAEMLIPRDHAFGTKRPCLESGYYAMYNRDNVRLVDVGGSIPFEITPEGVRAADGDHPCDVLVLASGFDAMTGALDRIDIRGRGDSALRDKWAHGPRTYLGLGIAGFPNLFTVAGPGSPSVLSNMMVSIEQHVEWIADCISHLNTTGRVSIEATAEAEEAWTEHVERVGGLTLYPATASWYTGANVPGKPRVFLPYVGGVGAYRKKCDEVAAGGYLGFALAE